MPLIFAHAHIGQYDRACAGTAPDLKGEAMRYVERALTQKLKQMAGQFPAVFLTGPRQSGKSTLLRHCFDGYDYVNLEEGDSRAFATDDPRGFRHILRPRQPRPQRQPLHQLAECGSLSLSALP